ncbi:MAG: fibronectin type III domain-containing protein [Chitinophagaceae bacterium]|nr:fibronectin type III domain-containing protein [Chitinophagaceae bacterium]
MKRIVLLAALALGIIGKSFSQNVFDPNDPIVRYSSGAAYGSGQKPDSNIVGLQKWVSVSTNGVSSGSGSFNASSFKSYFINYFNTRLAFRLKFPKSFNNPDSIAKGKKYPVMIFMHGAGEVACASNGGIYNNEKQLVLGGRAFMNRVDNNEYDGFLFYPQLRSKDAGCWGEWGGAPNANFNTIITLLDSMYKYIRLDIDRVFVDGLSGGGVATWRLAEAFPTRIATIAPTSAAGLIMDYPAFVHIPVWLATGGKDTNPSPAMASYSELKVTEIGGQMRRSLYADLGHSSWDRHWAEPDFVPFMNAAHKANPLIFFNRFEFCPDSGVNARLGITPGFYAYEWARDGETIATRTGNVNTIVRPEYIRSYTGNEVTVKEFGTYSVRFMRLNNGVWSDWSLKPAVIKSKTTTQTPPIEVAGIKSKVLPSLDGRNTTTLQMPPGFLNYQWVRTTDNVLVSTNQVYEAPIGSYKARYTEQFGCGTLYSPVFKVVSAAGTPKPDEAKNLSVSVASQTTLRLDWNENPNAGTNETGFEIYRATKAGGPYVLVNITAPNIVTYSDANLNPNTTYYYVVRAIAETGAAAASNEASSKTDVDTQAPAAPTGLEYRGSTATTVNLRWNAAADNIGIGRYDIYADGQKLYSTTNLYFTVGNLDSLQQYTFVVKAVDKAGNVSPSSNQVVAYTHRQGLNYKYYHGSYSNLPNFNNLTPVKTGIMDTVTSGAGVRTQDDNFAFLWQGVIYIPATGTWTFETQSDDGSRLYIDVPYASNATPVVDNDGAHGIQARSGSRTLTQGYHTIAITYAEVGGDNEMHLYWSNNLGLAKERIPKNFFAIEAVSGGTSVVAPSSLQASAVSYNKIALTWTDNSSNETGFEIVRATSANGTYTPIFTAAANATSYNDSALSPNTTYYYKVRAVSNGGESVFTGAFLEANYKFNNDYTDAKGGTSLSASNTAFSSSDKAEGTHAVVFTNNDYINFGGSASAFPSLGGYSQRTVGIWIKPSSTNSRRIVWEFGDNDDGMGLRFNSDDLIAGIANNGSRATITLSNFVSNSNWLNNQWNHVTVVYNVNSLTLYVNGVQVAQNASLSFTSVGNSTNQSRIGAPSSTSSSSTVFNDNSYSTYLGNMDNMYIIAGALSPADITALRNGTFASSSATTLAAPAAPAAPTGLAATVLSTSTITLTFNDVANNETGYEIWRGSGDKSNYRAIATIPAGNGGQLSFTDSSLFANVTYFFKVRATGVVAPSAYSAEVTGKTLNTKPVIKKVLNFTMKYGTTFSLPVSATDIDGDVLSFSTVNMPTFATIQPVSNGNMNIVLSPSITRRGTYTMSAIVNDGNNGKDTTTFTFVVNTNDVPAMSEVQDITINEGGSANLAISATDNNGTANMVWSFEGLPPFAIFTNNNNGSGNIAFKPGYSGAGAYPITIIVNDGFGAWSSRSLILTVNDRDPEETLQFDFRSVSAQVPGWNSINIASPTFSHGQITDTKSNVSPVSIVHVSGNVNASTQGTITGNNSGVLPDAVMKDMIVWGFNIGTNAFDTVVMKVTGLDVAKSYKFIFHAGYNLNGTTANIMRFRIGAAEATINYFLNTTMTDTIENIVPNASGEVTIQCIGDPNNQRGGLLNAMIIQSQYDDGSVPAKPTNFTGSHIQNSGVKLNWIDHSFNEFGYRVYRSETRGGSYTLLNDGAVNKDSTSYFDPTVGPETTYYYYVAGYNGAGTGISSDTIKVITGNNKPVIGAAADLYLKSGSTSNTDFTVTDDPGDLVNVTLEGNPSFISLQNVSGANYRFVSTPNTDHIGWYKMSLKATDQKGAVSVKVISVAVSDKNTRSVYVKFGSAGKNAPSPWNNFVGLRSANNFMANLRDESNAVTPFTITLLNTWAGYNELGHISGNNSGVYPDSVLQGGLSDGAGPKSIRISGLDDTKKYNIVIVGSQNEGTNATVEYSSGSTLDTLNAMYNTNQTANLNGLVPAGGQITFNALRIGGSVLSFLNAVVIEEYDPSLIILNPLNLFAEAQGRTIVNLSWSDRTVDEAVGDGYILERATDSLFTMNLASISLPANTSTYQYTGLTPNTKYWFRVRAKSATNAFSDYSNRAKAITAATEVLVNFNYTMPDADFPWNNTFASPTFEATYENMINSTGAQTGISLSLTRIFNGEFTAGMVTGNNSGMGGRIPDAALASDFWLDNTQLSQFKVSGLNHSRRYRVGFWGSSSSNGWFKGNYTATYTANGQTVYLNSWMNSSKIVYIDNIVPDENGEILLDFSTTEAAAYGFNGGFILEGYSSSLVSGSGTGSNSVLDEMAGMTVEEVDGGQSNGNTARNAAAQTSVVKMYPNPFTDYVNLEFNNSSANNKISVEVYDLTGRISYRKNVGTLPEGRNTIKLGAAEARMKTGVYIVTLSVNGKTIKANKIMKLNRH